MTPEDKPAFLDPAAVAALDYVGADVVPTFDSELAHAHNYAPVSEEYVPTRGIKERYRAIARLHSLSQTNNQIGRQLGYSPTTISIALKHPWVQAEVARYRAAYETDLTSRVKDVAVDGIERIHRMILDPDERSTTVLDASKWAIEKVTGKPKQEVSHESGTLTAFMELLRGMQTRGEAIDVTGVPHTDVPVLPEAQVAQNDQWDDWLDANL